MRTSNRWRFIVPAVAIATIVSGCGAGSTTKEQSNPVEQAKTGIDYNEAVELSIYASSSSFTEELFKTRIEEHVRKKFPNYKLKYVKPGSMTVPDMIATNNVPDIFLFALPEMQKNLFPNGLQYDLTELINKYNVDLNRFEPGLLQTFREVSGEGKLYGLPESTNPHVMFYNKDLYDKFGVPYPKNGMTWDEAYEMSRKLTSFQEGVSYKGVALFFRTVLSNNEDSLPLIDAKTERASVNTAQWKKQFDNLKRFYELNGMLTGYKPGSDGGTELTSFYTDKNMAAIVSPFSGYTRDGMKDMNWNMVSVPVHSENKGVGLQVEPRGIFIANTSKVKEQAFHVLMHVLSDEVELANSKAGKTTSLNNETIVKSFASEIDLLKGKNTSAVFYNKVAPSPQAPALSTNAGNLLSKEFDAVIQGNKDVNTALRNAEDTINKAIEEEIAKTRK
ncbi:ABC transporter substrate-binding protein [Paenibacillus hodogayensis]|uniref:ABC transporter substrate-binding protein n=1 Tax=Paenibacillus hodogayensis TaxID=279208 RepID=A0ABV5VSH1_9BACL